MPRHECRKAISPLWLPCQPVERDEYVEERGGQYLQSPVLGRSGALFLLYIFREEVWRYIPFNVFKGLSYGNKGHRQLGVLMADADKILDSKARYLCAFVAAITLLRKEVGSVVEFLHEFSVGTTMRLERRRAGRSICHP